MEVTELSLGIRKAVKGKLHVFVSKYETGQFFVY